MARELIIQMWCDRHSLRGERVEATVTRPLPLIPGEDREVDLCVRCDEQVYGPLMDLLEASRRTEDSQITPKKTEKWPCPLCEVVGKSKNGVSTHMGRIHGLSWAQWQAQQKVVS